MTRLHFAAAFCLAVTLTTTAHAGQEGPLYEVTGLPAGDVLNVRAGPGVSYADIGDLIEEAQVAVVGRSVDGKWLQILWFAGEGWISARYVVAVADPVPMPQTPQVFRVTGVAADDTLNIRAQPRASSDDIGDFTNDQRLYVTGQSPDGKWAQVPHGEGAGWVAMRYLAPASLQTMASGMPVGLNCGGNEPFWSLQINADGTMEFSDPEGTRLQGALEKSTRVERPSGVEYDFWAAPFAGTLAPQACNDSMSDRAYFWRLSLFGEAFGGRSLNGCCSLK